MFVSLEPKIQRSPFGVMHAMVPDWVGQPAVWPLEEHWELKYTGSFLRIELGVYGLLVACGSWLLARPQVDSCDSKQRNTGMSDRAS